MRVCVCVCTYYIASIILKLPSKYKDYILYDLEQVIYMYRP